MGIPFWTCSFDGSVTDDVVPVGFARVRDIESAFGAIGLHFWPAVSTSTLIIIVQQLGLCTFTRRKSNLFFLIFFFFLFVIVSTGSCASLFIPGSLVYLNNRLAFRVGHDCYYFFCFAAFVKASWFLLCQMTKKERRAFWNVSPLFLHKCRKEERKNQCRQTRSE